jgi:hypothetical protein
MGVAEKRCAVLMRPINSNNQISDNIQYSEIIPDNHMLELKEDKDGTVQNLVS